MEHIKSYQEATEEEKQILQPLEYCECEIKVYACSCGEEYLQKEENYEDMCYACQSAERTNIM